MIANKLIGLSGKSDEELETMYVNSLREHPLFGMHQYLVSKSNSSDLGSVLPDQMLLCIDPDTIKFADPFDPMKEVIMGIPMLAVVQSTVKNQTIRLRLQVSGSAIQASLPTKVKNSVNHELEFVTPMVDEIAIMLASVGTPVG